VRLTHVQWVLASDSIPLPNSRSSPPVGFTPSASHSKYWVGPRCGHRPSPGEHTRVATSTCAAPAQNPQTRLPPRPGCLPVGRSTSAIGVEVRGGAGTLAARMSHLCHLSARSRSAKWRRRPAFGRAVCRDVSANLPPCRWHCLCGVRRFGTSRQIKLVQTTASGSSRLDRNCRLRQFPNRCGMAHGCCPLSPPSALMRAASPQLRLAASSSFPGPLLSCTSPSGYLLATAHPRALPWNWI
jgi:hypothetical protein